jgi:hypothetical protein
MREFHLGLYLEHLEDASFLYQQRRALLRDATLPWRELQRFEARLEAHVDALVIGNPLALEACTARITDGDAGELFAIASACCRVRQTAMFAGLWRTIDPADAAKSAALTTALEWEMPQEWHPFCARAIEHGDVRWLPLLAEVCGRLRIDLGAEIATAVTSRGAALSDGVIVALARLPPNEAGMRVLFACLERRDDPAHARSAAALRALLVLGQRDVLNTCYLTAQTTTWPHLALGIGGPRSASTLLSEQVEAGRGSPDTVLALGLLGDVSTVRCLCRCLTDDGLADAAALALYWICGAPLYEDRFVAEPVVEAELLERELDAWRQRGEAPRRADGQPFGSMIRRLSREPERWDQWLNENAQRFDPGLRYRRGEPYSAAALLRCLLDETTPNALRALTYEELQVRYRCPVAFEADWRVSAQLRALRSLGAWVAQNGDA